MGSLVTYGKEFWQMWDRNEEDSEKSLSELITENNLDKFSNLEFDYFDNPDGVSMIPCEGHVIITRERWIYDASGNYAIIAEYALYKASHMWSDDEDAIAHINNLRYDMTYTLIGVCPETFPNRATAIVHATMSIYGMKGV